VSMSPRREGRSRTAATRLPNESQASRLLLGAIDGALAGSIFVVPMLLGGRHPLGQLVLVGLAVFAALAWAVRQTLARESLWHRSIGEWLLLGGAAVVAVQLIPLPPALLDRLAPSLSQIAPLWHPSTDASIRLGTWRQISLTPAATQGALVLFLAYGLLFLVTVQRLRSVDDVERLLRWCALSALLMAGFGLVQLVAGNGKFFWVYEHLYTDTRTVAKGAFTNRNHFAHFLALGLGPMIWWVQDSFHRRRKRSARAFGGSPEALDLANSLRVIGLGIVLFALLMSLSRGGALAALLAAAISVATFYYASRIGLRFVGTLGAVAVVIGVALTIVGHEQVARRLGTLTSASLDEIDRAGGRRTVWKANLRAIPDFAPLGAGAGSHREVYPMYLDAPQPGHYFSHAECGYLQVALETGAAGLALVLAGIGACAYWCVRSLRAGSSNRSLVCAGAVGAGLAASAAHSVVDFVWYVPGCMALVAVLAACACRLGQMAGGESHPGPTAPLSRPVLAAAIALTSVVGAWMLENRFGPALAYSHWERCVMLRRDAQDLLLFDGDPAEGETARADSETSEPRGKPASPARKRIIAELEEVIRWDPTNARAHLRLAQEHIRSFHEQQKDSANVMPLNMICDTVFRSQSETIPADRRLDSREKLEAWLARAFGEPYRLLDAAREHARTSLALCPLLGKGYLLLGELCFLEGGRQENKAACVAQALRVRPWDGDVLFHNGNEAVMAGDFERGFAFWQRAFQTGPDYQYEIVRRLAGRVYPMDVVQEIGILLAAFEPNLDGLRQMERCYRDLVPPEQSDALHDLRARYARAAESEAAEGDGRDTARLWIEAMGLYATIGAGDDCLRCGRAALKSDPNSYFVRARLARALAACGEFAQAQAHFEWCLKRRPDDRSLERELREVVHQATRQRIRAASGAGAAEAPAVQADARAAAPIRQASRPPAYDSPAPLPDRNSPSNPREPLIRSRL